MDFFQIVQNPSKKGYIEVYPKFVVKKSSDLMIRGGAFYAVWIEEKGLWSTEEQDVLDVIDRKISEYIQDLKGTTHGIIIPLYMWDAETGMIDRWHKYCEHQMRDNYVPLDDSLIFADKKTTKEDYASKKLPYSLSDGEIPGWERLVSTLYSEEERHKIEWCIGCVVSGESKKVQKFAVFYGSFGTGKSTIISIIESLFEGYYAVFDAKTLGSTSSQFPLEAFKNNPLVAIQHDGDLSKIEDNTRLNSIVSHELMNMNEKYKSTYGMRFKSFMFLGTNYPVKITDSKSGIIRRLIDIRPSGRKLSINDYLSAMDSTKYELGAIAKHCLNVYMSNPRYYDNYLPLNMMGATNDFYNFMLDSYSVFEREDSTTLNNAWEMYKIFVEESRIQYSLNKRVFKEELKNYFWEYTEGPLRVDGEIRRSVYKTFRKDKFVWDTDKEKIQISTDENLDQYLIEFKAQKSIFDDECADNSAQLANPDGTPINKWANVNTKLVDIDTSKLHYVLLQGNHIVIDFDLKNEKGEKDYELNLKAASKFPPTYAELSKSGAGIHLHYIYDGDVEQLNNLYSEGIEIKKFTGLASLRRLLTKCNDIPIRTISSGLPIKGEKKKMINLDTVQNEQYLRNVIKKALNKEIHANTRPNIDFIAMKLDEMFASGKPYDITDMRNAIIMFAINSTHQAEACMRIVNTMKFKSETELDTPKHIEEDNLPYVVFDIETFPNLLVVVWKYVKEGATPVVMINPKPESVANIFKYKLVGFNCRRYDNHILYARQLGYTEAQLSDLSQRIINGDGKPFFGEAYNISYTDIYDYSTDKMSLKKWELKLGIDHVELDLPWDKPVPQNKIELVGEYCVKDVLATEKVFLATKDDFMARLILADIAGLTPNDTTNRLTQQIIFGKDRNPQASFIYRNLGYVPEGQMITTFAEFDDILIEKNADLNTDISLFCKGVPIFNGYVFDKGVSTYLGETVGEGGYVYTQPGIHENVVLLDVASMHPNSAINENIFGTEYTTRFKELVDLRVAVKHRDEEKAKTLLGGALARHIHEDTKWDDLAFALKIAINSVYGLTSAKFPNAFKDPRNVDNIVAKRGALFMINLKHEVTKRGYTVAHIKTDSIKIANADNYIINFVTEYGKLYGYTFEHEATYSKMILLNKAVYAAKHMSLDEHKKLYPGIDIPKDNKKKEEKWTFTGAPLIYPHIYKQIFTKEPLTHDDMVIIKESITGPIHLDFNEKCVNTDKEITQLKKLYKTGEENTDQGKALRKLIDDNHELRFVGKVGGFYPVKDGCDGGHLVVLRTKEMEKYARTDENVMNDTDKHGEARKDILTASNVTGTSGYRWKEHYIVDKLEKHDEINMDFYINEASEVLEEIKSHTTIDKDIDWLLS